MPINDSVNKDQSSITSKFDEINEGPIDWADAERRVNSYKKFLKENKLGEILSFSLSQTSLNRLLSQADKLDAVKFYLAFSEEDRTISAFAVASKLNSETGEFDDFNIPDTNPGDAKALPLFENVRPCPHQCGIKNFLNTEI